MMDFKIDVNGVVSMYHAIMLKQYVERRNKLAHYYCLLKIMSQLTTTTMRNFRLMFVPFRPRRSRNRTVTSVFQIH